MTRRFRRRLASQAERHLEPGEEILAAVRASIAAWWAAGKDVVPGSSILQDGAGAETPIGIDNALVLTNRRILNFSMGFPFRIGGLQSEIPLTHIVGANAAPNLPNGRAATLELAHRAPVALTVRWQDDLPGFLEALDAHLGPLPPG
jgi:hypothetical protein